MGDEHDKRNAEIGRAIAARRMAIGMSQTDLSLRVFGKEEHQTIQKIENHDKHGKHRKVSADEIVKIAEALDTTTEFLLSARPRPRQVALYGDVGAGGEYVWHARAGRWMEIRKIDAPLGDHEVTAAVRVEGDHLQSAGYWDGDTLYFRFKGDPLEDALGKRAIVQMRDGGAFLGVLTDGARPGRYLFRSILGNEPVREVAVEWAARIRWHQQG
jgi:transcriptional regulator with XRE-family HTH domain